ncbi:hypothetical protein Q7C36_012129 [Tachysurus vachellii]|uniref:Selenoprotein P N-terminal domain-containing protein n=1 Tax=Tachysurus vachellii TaxID=175792 RepID=A0AA88MKQ8_TACVA|nr:hypothetical protein Q7C36_012129 [Tachysurus vachellii]
MGGEVGGACGELCPSFEKQTLRKKQHTVLVERSDVEVSGPHPAGQPAARLDDLRKKLEAAGLANITYMVVNSQDGNSIRLHSLLENKLSDNIDLYKQNPEDPDVWSVANAEKDDIQIYDRCGRLTHHLSLPYTILSQPHVEEAIRNTYCTAVCGDCELEQSDHVEACNRTKEEKTEEESPQTEHHHHHHSHHGGHHHEGHHHGGHHHGHHPHDVGERHSHSGSSHQHGQDSRVIVGQVQRGSFDLSQVERRQLDLGQAHVGQIDLGQVGIGHLDLGHVGDDVGNQQVMQRP